MTTWYELRPDGLPMVECDGKRVLGSEFEVASNSQVELSELRAPDGGLKLARTVHEAMTCVVQLLREKVQEIETQASHVGVLVRTPLTVLSADNPPKMVTAPCETCADCLAGGWECEKPVMVMNEDGTPKILPGFMGYAVFVIVSIVGTPGPMTCRESRETHPQEPWWLKIPPLDETQPFSFKDRGSLLHSLLPQRPL